MAKKVVIYGAGYTGIAIAEWLRRGWDEYRVIGFIDDNKRSHDYPVPILGGMDELRKLRDGERVNDVVLGFLFPVDRRLEKAEELYGEGFQFPSIYDRGLDDIYGVEIRRGVLIADTAVVLPMVKIGNYVAINHHTYIEPCEIGDGVIITPCVRIGANSVIGRGTIIYTGAAIELGRRIGEFCVIGTNTFVHHDLGDEKKYLIDR